VSPSRGCHQSIIGRPLHPADPILLQEIALTASPMATAGGRLNDAVRRSSLMSRAGLLELAFASLFKGLVYPQIWEDPDIDLEALAIAPDHHVVAIASGGCNILSYLIADPAHITALDLSKAHIALNRLKLAGVRRLPDYDSYYGFFGAADRPGNVALYARHLAPHLDDETRGYWETRCRFGFGEPRISVFTRNLYRHGLLGRFIGFGHAVAKLYGVDPRDMLQARTLQEQRTYFDQVLAPLFEKRFIRWFTERPISLYGLGIPPAQYAALAGAGPGGMSAILRQRVEKLTCSFSLNDNYFAWQALGRSYAKDGRGPLPPYLRAQHFDAIRNRADRAQVLNRSVTEFLQGEPAGSADRYVLLDAQDWMTDAQLNALWREITRTARPGARVIFRTAAEPSLLPGRLDAAILDRWHYESAQSRDLTLRDRSAIYGGFHLYSLKL
jgi:S-adenosylmethionine-diacylglycerol 3-amino-3-carboxypropyl transferase